MQFLYPAFLWALAALAIPIIIHLFYFRRFRRVYFTNVRFLREVKEETSARSRLRNLLVLLMRLLAVAFLVFAFAQPFLPTDTEVTAGRRAVSVYVDNSFSMSAGGEDRPLVERAKSRAREIVSAYGVEDRFHVLTNDFLGRRQRLLGKEEALEEISQIEIGPAVRQLSTVLARQRQALGTEDLINREAYVLSDFQTASSDLTPENIDTSVQVILLPLRAADERNVGIDSAWFEAPVPQLNQNNLLLVRVKNYSDEDVEDIRLSLDYNGQIKPEGLLSIPAGGTVTDSVFINIAQPGLGRATLRITDFPVTFDDTYYVTFRVADKVRVLNIHDGSPDRYLGAALSGLRVFDPTYTDSRNIDYGSLGDYGLVILSDLGTVTSGLATALRNYVNDDGGNLLVFPARSADLASYRTFLAGFPANELQAFTETPQEVSGINTDEFIFRDVFENRNSALRLPATTGNFPLTAYGGRNQENLLTYRGGGTALAKYSVGGGYVYLSAAPLSATYNNLSQNAEVFIPMLYKMAISSGSRRPAAYTIGSDEVITTERRQTSQDIVYRLRGPGEEFIPEQRIVGSRVFLSVGEDTREAGFYDLFRQPGETDDLFAFNYDRRESNPTHLDNEQLADLTNERVSIIEAGSDAALTARISERNQGRTFWRWCLIAALVFLGLETLLLRFWKV